MAGRLAGRGNTVMTAEASTHYCCVVNPDRRTPRDLAVAVGAEVGRRDVVHGFGRRENLPRQAMTRGTLPGRTAEHAGSMATVAIHPEVSAAKFKAGREMIKRGDAGRLLSPGNRCKCEAEA